MLYNHRRSDRLPPAEMCSVFAGESLLLPTVVDLRQSMPPVLNQGSLGSCTAQATSNAIRYCMFKRRAIVFQPSRLFIYYWARDIGGNASRDSGANICDVMEAIHYRGVCEESVWPYNIEKFATYPSGRAIGAALQRTKGFGYQSLKPDLTLMKTCLAQGFPIIVGLVVYRSFQTTDSFSTGIIPLPNRATEPKLGGHCVLLTGYDATTFTFQNSWGTGIGRKGYFTIPHQYLLDHDLAFDFWTIQNFI